MATALISLGSNVGDRESSIATAIRRLAERSNILLAAVSRLHSTHAVGGPKNQPEFLNAAARLETELSPESLLDVMLNIESELGRVRSSRWGARRIDLDLLLFDELVCRTARLTLPHPRMTFRRFVLEPAVEVAADMVHPHTRWTNAQLLDHLNSAHDYLAISSTVKCDLAGIVATACELTGAFAVFDPLVDSPSPGATLDLEYLRRRANSLQAVKSHNAAISDFWFDDSLIDARRQLTGERLKEWETNWSERRAALTPPKLLVLLDPPNDKRTAARADAIRDYILREFRRPVLHLKTADFETAFEEITAALKTMKRPTA